MPRPFAEVADVPRSSDGGIGLVFTGGIWIRGGLLLSFDMDACRDPESGTLTQWADDMLEHYRRSYAEVTPSRTGLRLYIAVRNPPMTMPKIRVPQPAPPGVNKYPEVQTFGCGAAQYVTVTGDQVPGTKDEPVVVDDLSWLLEYFSVRIPDVGDEKMPEGTGEPPTHATIRACLERSGAIKLLEGRWEEMGFPSASECWYQLVIHVLRAANHHGPAAVDFLLDETAFGSGVVDSRDPDRYMRRGWVTKDVARIAGKAGEDGTAVFTEIEQEESDPTSSSDSKAGGRLLTLASLADRVGRVQFLVRGVLPHRGLGRLFGDPGSGKSTVAVSLALHVVAGEPRWCGYEMPQGQGRVAYISGEGTPGLVARFVAGARHLGVPPASLDELLVVSSDSGSLSDRADVTAWCVDLDKFALGSDLPLRLIVVDTQARNFGPGNEDKAEDMGRFLAGVQTLADRYGCLVLVVHHTGHQDKSRGRGSSAALGAMDVELKTAKKKGTSTVKVSFTKAKDFEEGPGFFGNLIGVPLSDDADDTAAVFVHTVFPEVDGGDEVSEEFLGDEELSNAARVAVVLADSPGLGSRDVRRKVRERGSLASSAVDEALAALGSAVAVRSPGREKQHYLVGERVSDRVQAHLSPEERDAVLAARPPQEEV